MEDRQNISIGGIDLQGNLNSTGTVTSEMDTNNDLDSTSSLDSSRPPVEIENNNLLDEVVDINDVDTGISNENDGNNVLEPMDIFVVQPDGTKVRISFLANGDFISDPHILLTDSDCESSTFSENVIIPNSDNLTDVSKGSEIIATFVNAESSQQVSAIQMADGQIYYIESFPAPILEPSYELLNSSEDLKLCTVNPTIIEEPSEQEVMETNTSKPITNYKSKLKKLPSNKIPKTHQTESSVLLVGNDLMIEDKLQLVEYMMPRQRRRVTYIKVAQEEKEMGTYNCDMCNASYPKAKQFYGHSRTHTKERQLHCTLCVDKKVFSAHGKLNSHERRFHTNVREHECAVCNAKFDRASQLGYHMRRVHMNERSHVCSFCQKAFFKLSDLKSHINIHLGLYSNVCHTCGKKFNHISNLNRHLLTHSDAVLRAYLLLVVAIGMASSAPASPTLKSDLDDLVNLIPVDKILPVVVDYLAADDQVKQIVAYMRTDEFKMIVGKIVELPEYKNLLDFLESIGLHAYKNVNAIHTVLGLPGLELKTKPTLTGGVKGLLKDVAAVLPIGQLNDAFEAKLENNPQLQSIVDRFQGQEFQSIIEKLNNIPEFMTLLKKFKVDQLKKDFNGQ